MRKPAPKPKETSRKQSVIGVEDYPATADGSEEAGKVERAKVAEGIGEADQKSSEPLVAEAKSGDAPEAEVKSDEALVAEVKSGEKLVGEEKSGEAPEAEVKSEEEPAEDLDDDMDDVSEFGKDCDYAQKALLEDDTDSE